MRKLSMNRGITLLEVLLVLALVAALAGLSVPIYQSFQVRNELDIAAQTMAQQLRRAQVLARGVSGDSGWGVHATTSAITLFRGTNHAARNKNFDETTSIPSNISVSGTQEFVFAKFTGLPTVTGTLTFTSVNNETKNITLNAKGMVSY